MQAAIIGAAAAVVLHPPVVNQPNRYESQTNNKDFSNKKLFFSEIKKEAANELKIDSRNLTNDETNSNEAIPSEKSWDLVHYNQTKDWDCGTSCVLMVLPVNAREDIIKNHSDFHMEEQFGYDLGSYTIDLVFVLNRFNVPFIYYTNTIGLNPGRDKIVLCQRSRVGKAQNKRVNKKFKQAEGRGVIVELKADMSIDDIIKHLGRHGPAILLTDSRYLYCQNCDQKEHQKFGCVGPLACNGYGGHYIVLMGYDQDKKIIKFRDPSKSDRVCQMTIDEMDKARTAYGTNNDLVAQIELRPN